MHDLQNPFGCAGFHHQFGQTHGYGRIALAGFQNESVARRYGHAEHPHRDHGGEIERCDARADAQWLAHGEHIDARPGPLRIFTLQRVRHAAGELDHVQPALHIAARIGDHLAVFAAEQRGEVFHVRFDQPFEFEHDAGALLRIGGRPTRLRFLRGGNCPI